MVSIKLRKYFYYVGFLDYTDFIVMHSVNLIIIAYCLYYIARNKVIINL